MKVNAIRDQALALGWTEAALYQNRGALRFPVGGDYGLVCFLHGGRELGQVTREHIEIIAPSGTRSRFYNRDAPQPWIRRAGSKIAPEARGTSRLAPVCNR